ncbi:hypothetical protein AB0B50_01655 [Streptomyces sp. NPDC041068]|uniref:hypothetical protein n=1 Tax=Streptomyces sp. NPDC041068 TaxID=3155130 RepID=UPI0033F31971
MTARPRVFMAFSSRAPADATLAARLTAVLRARGVPVAARADDTCTHFLAILSGTTGTSTSASTPAERDVAEQIASAVERRRSHGTPALFLLAPDGTDLGRLAAPVGPFRRIRWHDGFGAQVDEVARALDVPVTLPSGAAGLIDDKTAGFLGREYVFDAIDDFVGGPAGRGYFRLEGDPGDGKTAIMAEYVRRTGCVAHFNVRSQGIVGARQFVTNLGAQLRAKYGIAAPADAGDTGRYGELVGRMLAEARAALPDDVPLIVAVDALDEAERQEESDAVNVLFLPPVLPAGVYVLVSSRRAEVPLRIETAWSRYDLGEHLSAAMVDIRDFLTRTGGSHSELAAWLAYQRIPLGRFVDVLAEKSEGNFMYLRHVLPELSGGLYSDLDIQQLPHGLENYYESHWRLMGMTARPSPRTKIWVVYVLCEVASPVSIALLARVMRETDARADAIGIQEVLTDWRQFLRRESTPDGPRFSIYHSSFRDFLKKQDTVSSAGVSIKGINEAISDVLWENEYGNEHGED